MIFEKQIEKLYRNMLFRRCDDRGAVFYFSHEDFPGLQKEPYTFLSKKGDRLSGAFYHYDTYDPKRLIVFDHGMGGGHRSYMREIEMLCGHGYLVFAYDHTGCMESEGVSTDGLAQSLADLDACLDAIEGDQNYRDLSLTVMGHSWGAFSTMNIAALHKNVTHLVAIAGFASVGRMLAQNFPGILKGYQKRLFEIERESNAPYVSMDARDSLRETEAKVLLIYSADDPQVKKSYHYDYLRDALSDKENIEILLTEGKGHNPNYTLDAVRVKDAFFKRLTQEGKKKRLETQEARQAFKASFDWRRMTEQDMDVWKIIFAHLEK